MVESHVFLMYLALPCQFFHSAFPPSLQYSLSFPLFTLKSLVIWLELNEPKVPSWFLRRRYLLSWDTSTYEKSYQLLLPLFYFWTRWTQSFIQYTCLMQDAHFIAFFYYILNRSLSFWECGFEGSWYFDFDSGTNSQNKIDTSNGRKDFSCFQLWYWGNRYHSQTWKKELFGYCHFAPLFLLACQVFSKNDEVLLFNKFIW